jgi:hypothetical protein
LIRRAPARARPALAALERLLHISRHPGSLARDQVLARHGMIEAAV